MVERVFMGHASVDQDGSGADAIAAAGCGWLLPPFSRMPTTSSPVRLLSCTGASVVPAMAGLRCDIQTRFGSVKA